MFLPFFAELRAAGVPVSIREFLAFLEGVAAGIATYDLNGFYHLARVVMVKDEQHLDRFDRAFAASFNGLEAIPDAAVLDALDLPRAWLEKLAEEHLTPEERAEVQASGGFEALMERLRQRLAAGQHQKAASGKLLHAGDDARVIGDIAESHKILDRPEISLHTQVRKRQQSLEFTGKGYGAVGQCRVEQRLDAKPVTHQQQ